MKFLNNSKNLAHAKSQNDSKTKSLQFGERFFLMSQNSIAARGAAFNAPPTKTNRGTVCQHKSHF